MAEPDPGIVQSVINGNHKTIAEAGSFAVASMFQTMAQLMAEQAASAGRRTNMADAAMASYLKNMNEIDPSEAVSTVKELQGDLPSQLANLGSVIAQIQQMMKGAQTTPPPTG